MNNIFSIYEGEYVRLTLRLYVLETKGSDTFQVPIFRDGFLLDEDAIWYHFGTTAVEVNFSIKKKDVSSIELVEVPSIYSNVLDNMSAPKKNGDIN